MVRAFKTLLVVVFFSMGSLSSALYAQCRLKRTHSATSCCATEVARGNSSRQYFGTCLTSPPDAQCSSMASRYGSECSACTTASSYSCVTPECFPYTPTTAGIDNCPPGKAKLICGSANYCVPPGSFCCGSAYCVPGQACIKCGMAYYCAPPGSTCCGSSYCPPGKKCVFNGSYYTCK